MAVGRPRAHGLLPMLLIVYGAVGRAGRSLFDVFVRAVEVGGERRVGRGLLVFQGPLFLGAVNLAQVVDAGVGLGLVARFQKLGIAIAANRPMMATTIMISTSVKPDLREVLFLHVFGSFSECGVNIRLKTGYMTTVPFTRLPSAGHISRMRLAK